MNNCCTSCGIIGETVSCVAGSDPITGDVMFRDFCKGGCSIVARAFNDACVQEARQDVRKYGDDADLVNNDDIPYVVKLTREWLDAPDPIKALFGC